VTLHLKVAGDRVEDIRFEGQGCAISTASASLMTEAIKGKTIAEAHELFAKFHKMVAEEGGEVHWPEEMASLEALSGVKEFPVRVKCATLAWHTLEAALQGVAVTSTE
jgi:nitrogen fixation NifU-like protein